MTSRLQELMWVPAYLDDLESDLSALHRIDDIYAMDSARFFRFAERTFAYKGVMRMRAEQEHERAERPQPQRPHQPAPRQSSASPGMSVSELMVTNPGLVEKVQVPA